MPGHFPVALALALSFELLRHSTTPLSRTLHENPSLYAAEPERAELATRASHRNKRAPEPERFDTVTVQLLSRYHLKSVQIQDRAGTQAYALRADGDVLWRQVTSDTRNLQTDYAAVPQESDDPHTDNAPSGSATALHHPLELADTHWVIRTPQRTAQYQGPLTVRAVHGQLQLILTLPLEAYVARVVGSESEPETPGAALQALAVVVRSYAASSVQFSPSASGSQRHGAAQLCDLSHCQVFKETLSNASFRAAQRAAQHTKGLVLWLVPPGKSDAPRSSPPPRLCRPVFHAACGGHTARPEEIFPGENVTGASAVADPGCPLKPWQTRTDAAVLKQILTGLLRPAGGSLRTLPPLRLERGLGGYTRMARFPTLSQGVTGEALFRALGERLGWSRVRSTRFTLHVSGNDVLISGSGLGHGVGLCQTGAAQRARAGQSASAILKAYFPAAVLAPLPSDGTLPQH